MLMPGYPTRVATTSRRGRGRCPELEPRRAKLQAAVQARQRRGASGTRLSCAQCVCLELGSRAADHRHGPHTRTAPLMPGTAPASTCRHATPRSPRGAGAERM